MELGKYQIFEELGRGAFATVYRALDTTLDREVALKILHPQLLTDPTFVERFKREARAMANLDHQHIATVYEIGEAEERVYIAMQLARGPNLGEAIAEQGCFSWEQALALLRPVCEALDYAHSQNVVHRDLKPSNVLLDPDGDRGPLLTDFGFARLMGDSSVSLSLSGGILGTPAYIAPEVWELDKAEPPADVYALGCILYEVLTGEVLFAGKTPMQAMRAHDQGPQLPQEWQEDVPAGIETVLEKALARDPQERYSSGMALWHALNDLEAQAQAAQEAAQQAAVAAQWQEETEVAMAAGEWSVAKMAAARWLAVAPGDPDAQEAQAEIERQLKGPPVDEEEDKKEKKESKKKEEEEEEEPDQEGEPTIPTSVPSGPKVPVWAWALGGVALLALVIYLAGAPGMGGDQTPEIVEKVVIATSTSAPRPSATATSIPESSQDTTEGTVDIGSSQFSIKVAKLFPMSGDVKIFGESCSNGVELAFNEARTAGWEIKVILGDTKCDAQEAANVANKGINQDKVNYIVGAVCSSASVPISEIANPASVLQISPTSTNPQVTINEDGSNKEYIFRACFLDPFQGEVNASFAINDLGAEKAAVLYDVGNDYVKGLAEYFKASFEELGGEVPVFEAYTKEDTDFSALLTKVADADVDVLFLPDYYNKVNVIAKQAKEKGIDATMLGADGWDSPLLDLEAVDGGYHSNHYSSADPRPIVQNFVENYEAEFGQAPDALAALSYDAARLLLQAISEAGSDDPAAVKDALMNIEYEGVTGDIIFNKYGDPQKAVAINQVEDGEIKFVKFQSP